MSDTLKTAKIIKRRYHSPVTITSSNCQCAAE